MGLNVDQALINSGRDYLADFCDDKQNHPALQKAIDVFNESHTNFKDNHELWCNGTMFNKSGFQALVGYDFIRHVWSRSVITSFDQRAKIIADIWIATSRNLIDQLFPEKEKSEAVKQFFFNHLLPSNLTPEEFVEQKDENTARDAGRKIGTFIERMSQVANGSGQKLIKKTAEIEAEKQAIADQKAYEKTDAYKIKNLEAEIATLEKEMVPFPAENVLMQPNKVQEILEKISNYPAINLTQNQREKFRPSLLKALTNLKEGKVLKDELALLSPEANRYFFDRVGCGDYNVVDASGALESIVDSRNILEKKKSQLEKLKNPLAAPKTQEASSSSQILIQPINETAKKPQITIQSPELKQTPQLPDPSEPVLDRPVIPNQTATEKPIDPVQPPFKEPVNPKPSVEHLVKPTKPAVNKPIKKASALTRFFRGIGNAFTAIGKWIAKLLSRIFGSK